jgi:ATP-dependent Zn protease
MTTSPPPPIPPTWQTLQPSRSFGKGVFGWALFIGLAVMLFVLLKTSQSSTAEVALSDLTMQLERENVRDISIDKDELTGEFLTPPSFTNGMTRFRTSLPEGLGSQWSFVQWMIDHRGQARVSATHTQSLLTQMILPFIPWLLIFGFVWFFIFRQLRIKSTQRCAPMPVVIVDPNRENM